MNSARRTPAVMSSSPSTPSAPETLRRRRARRGRARVGRSTTVMPEPFCRGAVGAQGSRPRRGVIQPRGAGVGGHRDLVTARHREAQPHRLDVLTVDLHAVRRLDGRLQRLRVADGRDRVGRGVVAAVQQQHVAHAAHRGGRGDALVLDHHRLGSTGPHRVHHRLEVLLVDHEDVGMQPAGRHVRRHRRIPQLDDETRPGHRRLRGRMADEVGLLRLPGGSGLLVLLLLHELVAPLAQLGDTRLDLLQARGLGAGQLHEVRRAAVGLITEHRGAGGEHEPSQGSNQPDDDRTVPSPTPVPAAHRPPPTLVNAARPPKRSPTTLGAVAVCAKAHGRRDPPPAAEHPKENVPVPESKRRKKKSTYTPPPAPAKPKETPRWWVPTAVTLMVVGMLWVVVTYVAQARFPIPEIGNYNLAIGFVVLLAGFLMTLRWR